MRFMHWCRLTLATLFVIGASVFCSSAHGTEASWRLATLRYHNSSGERGITMFETDERGAWTRAVWMLEDGSRSSINRYVSDPSGRLVQTNRVFSDGVTLVERFEYVDGRLAVEHFERSDGVAGLTRYTYGEDGRLNRVIAEKMKGWFTGELVPSYDDVGRKTHAEVDRDGTAIGRIDYTWDKSGNLTREHWDFNGKWSQTFEYGYRPCSEPEGAKAVALNAFVTLREGWRIAAETYDFSGEAGGPSSFEYDESNRLVRKKFVRSDGLTTETDYLYDCNGLVTVAQRRYTNGRAAVFSYTFDARGSLVTRKFVRSDGVEGSEIYVRDDEGRLKSARFDRMDSWLTGDLAFEYDRDGRLSTGAYSADDGSTATITFDHDENGNLTTIRWVFSFGKTQTYRFEWEPDS